jgi:hypothetical protein
MIQYPKLVHATLPSADEYNGNTSIIKDPPKSIFTRRIQKVNDHNEITEEIDGAGDRICEFIKPFARGINPFVATEYSNYGNERTQAYLPYRVVENGAFRPPIIKPQDLRPLSRQVRLYTPITSAPEYIKQTLDCVNSDAPRKEINVENVITSCVARPAAIYSVNTYDDTTVYTTKNIGNPTYKTFSTNANSYISTPRYEICPKLNNITENYSLQSSVAGRAQIDNSNYVRAKLNTASEKYSLRTNTAGHVLNGEINVAAKLNNNNTHSLTSNISNNSNFTNNNADFKKLKNKIGSFGSLEQFGTVANMETGGARNSLIQLPQKARICARN